MKKLTLKRHGEAHKDQVPVVFGLGTLGALSDPPPHQFQHLLHPHDMTFVQPKQRKGDPRTNGARNRVTDGVLLPLVGLRIECVWAPQMPRSTSTGPCAKRKG